MAYTGDMQLTEKNIDKKVEELKEDLGVERLSDHAALLDELVEKAVRGFAYDENQEDEKDQLDELKEAMYQISNIASSFWAPEHPIKKKLCVGLLNQTT